MYATVWFSSVCTTTTGVEQWTEILACTGIVVVVSYRTFFVCLRAFCPELACRVWRGLHVLSELRVCRGNGAWRGVCTTPRKRLVVCGGKQLLATRVKKLMDISCWCFQSDDQHGEMFTPGRRCAHVL